jgi:hypothetical protein
MSFSLVDSSYTSTTRGGDVIIEDTSSTVEFTLCSYGAGSEDVWEYVR